MLDSVSNWINANVPKQVQRVQQISVLLTNKLNDVKSNNEQVTNNEYTVKMEQEDATIENVEQNKKQVTVKEIGNFIYSISRSASVNVIKTANQLKDVLEKTSIIENFNKENEKFVNEIKVQQRREESAVPPWVGYNQEEKLKQQILEVSKDPRNFLLSPPAGTNFHFNMKLAYPSALATLNEDPNLNEMRFKLVPGKIKEETFWKNYFYRVSLVKQSFQLEELNNLDEKNLKRIEGEIRESLEDEDTDKESVQNEFVSDLLEERGKISLEEINNDLKQFKIETKTKEELDLEFPDWDDEVAGEVANFSVEELEKEINDLLENK